MKRDLGKQMQDIHARFIAPLEASAQRIFSSEDGRKVLDALSRAFIEDDVLKGTDGRVDANAHLIAFGQRRVIDYLRKLAEPKEGQGQ